MALTGQCAGVLAQALARTSPQLARKFGFWYRQQTVLHPRWCAPIEWKTKVKLANGALMLAPFCEVQGMSLILDSCWEPEVTARILDNLKPGDVFIDAGANMGYYSVMASKAVGSDGLAIAFEPSQSNLLRLVDNLTINGCSNVVVISLALSDRSELAKLWDAPYYNTGVCSLRNAKLEQAVRYQWTGTTRLDDLEFIGSLESRISVLKVDVEGFELKALRGAETLLQNNPRMKVVCELSPQWYASTDLMEFFQALGYRGEYFDAGRWHPLTGATVAKQCNAWFWRGS